MHREITYNSVRNSSSTNENSKKILLELAMELMSSHYSRNHRKRGRSSVNESSSSASFVSHYPDKLKSHFSANIVLRAVKESAHLVVASLVAMCPYVCVHVSVGFIASDLMYCCYLIYCCELPFTVAKLLPSIYTHILHAFMYFQVISSLVLVDKCMRSNSKL